MEDFLSLRHLLEEDYIPPHNLVATIDQQGIHQRYHPKKPPLRHDSNSFVCFEAIRLIADHEVKKSNVSKESKNWMMFDEDDLDRLGWIRQELNLVSEKLNFRWFEDICERSELIGLWNPKLHTLGRLLMMDKAEIGELATAIEMLGVHGIDRFERIKWYPPKSGEAHQALDGLAWFANEHFMLPSIFDAFSNQRVFLNFGWIHAQTPDFKSIAIEHERAQQINATPNPNPLHDEDSPNGAKSKMTLIAGLFALVDGRLTGRKHPEYVSQASLVTILSAKLKPLYGSREGAIDLKFADANRILKAHESNLVEAPVSNRRRSKAQPRQSKAPKKPS